MLQLSRRDWILGSSVSAFAGETHQRPPFATGSGWKPLLNGRDLTGWHQEPAGSAEWSAANSPALSPGNPKRLEAQRGQGSVIVNGAESKRSNLVTNQTFGDAELYLEFLLSEGSNSGVYLHGLYEVQIFDSFNKTGPLKAGEAGGIYERWENNRGFQGSPPRVNASKPPGEWQWYHISFQAPRFRNGRKTVNAMFRNVVYNGLIVQQNYACTGPTRSGLNLAESFANPLMLQGDHGPVAFQNIFIRNL